MSLTFGSLFAGIGGIDLGFERAGMVCKWQVEKDDWCQRVLAKHPPDVPKYEDVHDVGSRTLEPVDVIAGGFPCQPHSLAGKRRGAADDRNLWPEYFRIVTELNPTWVVAENVPGIRNTILDTVLSDLDGAGYAAIPLSIPAAAFDTDHRRERIFIIAHAGSKRLQGVEQVGATTRPANGVGGNNARVDTVPDVRRLLVHDSPDARPRMRLPDVGRGSRDRLESIYWALAGIEAESGICGVAHGVPRRVDRLRGLGNAVVPQVAEFVGRMIVEWSEQHG